MCVGNNYSKKKMIHKKKMATKHASRIPVG